MGIKYKKKSKTGYFIQLDKHTPIMGKTKQNNAGLCYKKNKAKYHIGH